MIEWPQTLVNEIARRRCILFLGAGVSASTKNSDGESPKEWKSLLTSAAELISDENKKNDVKQLITNNKLLIALQAISREVDAGDYHQLLNLSFNNGTFVPSKLHKVIFELDSRIVITTNFDKIYERYCLSTSTEGFKVIPYYSDSLADEIRSDNRLIIKAHGTIDEVAKMVFTKAEYHNAKEKYASFYSILRALLLTNTCIFIGCSMDDPDVLLLLEEVKFIANSKKSHYALFKEGSISSYIKEDLLSSYNIKCLEYSPSHRNLVTDLKNLLEQVEAKRVLG